MNLLDGGLIDLANYWMTYYAASLGTTEQVIPPVVVVVGHQADAIASYDGEDVDGLPHTVACLVYPCDAVRVVVLYSTPTGLLVCWAHTLATNESVATVMARRMTEDGNALWTNVGDPGAALFDHLHAAAHDFDRFDLEPDEHELREGALETLRTTPMEDAVVSLHEPGYILSGMESE